MLRGVEVPDLLLRTNLNILNIAFCRLEIILPFASDARQCCRDLNMGSDSI